MSEQRYFHPLEDRSRRKAYKKGAKLVKIKTEHNGWSLVKTMFTAFLILLQLAIILSLNFLFVMGLKWYLVLLAGISVITAISVLSSHRCGQAKAVWVLFILVFFVFGFIVYFMSNDKIMYRRARKRHKKIFDKTSSFVKPYVRPFTSTEMELTCSYLHNAGNFVPYSNTKLSYFPSGAATFDDIIERLKSAEDFIFIEYFAIADGVLLNRILDVLLDKLAKGVEVKIIYDDMGSRVLSLKTRKKIKSAGGKIRVFNPLLSRFTFALNYRDHRKIVVVDGKTAYAGGVNLADEYINEKRMHGYWKDNGLRLDGEAVDALTLTFLRQWEYIVRGQVNYERYLKRYEKIKSDYVVVPYADGPEYAHSICKSVYENVISSAKEKLYIMTPYFIPDDSITQGIINKALAGVDVRIVLPSVPDKYYVYLLTKNYAEKLIKYGVKVYYMKDAFVHAKTVITEACAVVGSVNFDLRSFYQQFENAVISDDPFFLSDVSADFEQAFADSKLMEKPEKTGPLKALATWALRIVAPLM